MTYTVAFDTTATLRYGFTKALLDDGTITELGMGRCFAGFGLLDAQTGTVFAPQQGAGNWPWSVPYLGYNSYTVVMRPQAEADKKYSDAPSPTREDPCQQVRPLTSYTLDDGRHLPPWLCRGRQLGFWRDDWRPGQCERQDLGPFHQQKHDARRFTDKSGCRI